MRQMYTKTIVLIPSNPLSLDDDGGPLCRGSNLSSRVDGPQLALGSLVMLLVGVKVGGFEAVGCDVEFL